MMKYYKIHKVTKKVESERIFPIDGFQISYFFFFFVWAQKYMCEYRYDQFDQFDAIGFWWGIFAYSRRVFAHLCVGQTELMSYWILPVH